jgi:outer membrane protein assembly factor BamB
MIRSSARLLTGLVLLAAAGRAAADNWPQWRNAAHDGVSKEAVVPTHWDKTTNVAWTFKLPGMGGSTPIVWGDRIFLTCADGKDFVLLCIGVDGKERWKSVVAKDGIDGWKGIVRSASSTGRVRTDEGNGASASASTDGKHVWCFVGSGELACFDFDGKEVWKFNLQDRYGKFRIQFGLHSTPVLDGDRLYLQLIHSGGGQVIALDKATGKEIWKVKRPSDGTQECEHSYASATLWRNGKDAVLVAHGNDYATGHSLDDGHELWRVGGLNPKSKYNFTLRFVSTPAVSPDLIVVPSAKHGPVVGLKPSATGMVEAGSSFEQWRMPRNTPDVSSPLIQDGLVYLCGEDGTLTCVDAKTGAEQYSKRLHSARYRASPVYAAGHVYLTSRDGYVTVVKAGPKFELIAENKMGDEMSASPAIADGRIYLRGFETLFAIGGKGK